MTRSERPPRLATALLRLRSLGARRIEIETDLADLFLARRASRGPAYARRRYWRDVLSLWTPRARNRREPIVDGRVGPSWAEACRSIMQDVTHAARLFRRQPGVLAAAVIGLGVTIAVATTIFSVLNAVVLRPIGVAEPASFVRILRSYTNGVSSTMSYEEYAYLRAHAHSVTLEATSAGRSLAESGGSDASDPTAVAEISFVSGTFFATLGGATRLGRSIGPGDDRPGAPPVVVVSDWYWQRRLGGDPAIVGTTLPFNGEMFTVVGVSDGAFRGPTNNPPNFWAPLSTYPRAFAGSALLNPGATEGVIVWGHLGPGVSREGARAELSSLSAGIVAQLADPDVRTRAGVRVDAAGSRFTGNEQGMVLLAVGIVSTAIGLTLLLACMNLTNLLLASGTTRQGEIGVRLAIGATRRRVVRQLLTESLGLGLLAGGAAWLFTLWGLPLLISVAGVPDSFDVAPDWRVYVFLAAVTIAVGLGAGIVPAIRGTRGSFVSPLMAGRAGSGAGRRSPRVRTTLVAVQAGACLVLLVSAALLTRSVIRAPYLNLGFDVDRLLVVSPDLQTHGYDAGRANTFFDRAVATLRLLPGVDAVSIVRNPPLGNRSWTSRLTHAGRPVVVHHNSVEPGYFATMGLPVVRGRLFPAARAGAGANDVIVSANLAAAMPDGVDPIGLPLSRIDKTLGNATVVGVIADARVAGNVRDTSSWYVYEAIAADDRLGASIVIRAGGEPRSLVTPAKGVIRTIDATVRPDVAIVADSFHNQFEDVRLFATVSGMLGGLALCLAVTGIYGITAFAVSQRAREIGVRIAIGATNQQVLRLLVRDLMRPITIGLVFGGALALVAGQLLSGALVGLSARDPVSFAAGAVLLAAAAMGAILIPARRVLRIHPASILRAP